MEPTDRELLQSFLREQSENAFRQLMNRHLAMVIGTARRLLANDHAAQEVAQNAFVLLAQKGGELKPEQTVAGWLHRTARNEAMHVQRAEGRRRQREQTAVQMDQLDSPAAEPEVLAELESALEELGQEDQDILLLRFLEDRKLPEVGEELGISSDAARMRVNRAVDKLRSILGQRGIATSSGALTAILVQQATATIPAGLGATILSTVLGQSTVAAGAGAATVATWLNIKTAAAVLTGVAVVGTLGLFFAMDDDPSSTQTANNVTNLQSGAAPTDAADASTVASGPNQSTATTASNANAQLTEAPPTAEAQRLAQEAWTAIQEQRYEDALALLDQSIDISPRNPEAWLFRGNALEGVGKPEEALEAHRHAAALRPDYPQAWYEQSRILDSLARYDEAIAACNRVIEIDPEFWQAWLGRGRAKYMQLQNREAIADFEKVVELNPDWLETYDYLAQLHQRIGEIETALEYRRTAIELAPDDAMQHARLGHTLWYLGRYEPALEPLTRAIELDPAFALPWRLRAHSNLRLERYRDCIRDYEESLRLEPQNHHGFNNRGMAYFFSGNSRKALADLNRAIQMAPDHTMYFVNRSRIHLNLNQPDQAHEDLDQAAKMNARVINNSWRWLGEVAQQSGDPEAAISFFTLAINQAFEDHQRPIPSHPKVEDYLKTLRESASGKPDASGHEEHTEDVLLTRSPTRLDEELFMYRGVAELQSGRYTNALNDLEVFLYFRPNSARGHWHRGQAFEASEDFQSALTGYSKAIELDERFAVAWEHRANLLYNLGQYEKALADYRQVMQLNEKSAYPALMAGWCAHQLGRPEEAIGYFTQAIRREPGNVEGFERRGSLHAELQQWEAALQDYGDAVKLEPDAGRFHFYKSFLNLPLNNLPAAVASANKALEVEEMEAWMRQYLVILAALGKMESGEMEDANALLNQVGLNDGSSWPAPVIRFLRGDLSFDELLSQAANPAETGEARTYAAWKLLIDGKPASARTELKWMLEQGDQRLFEYHLAQILFRRLNEE